MAGIAVRTLAPETRRAALRHAAVYLAVLLVAAVVWYSTEAQRQAFLGFLHNPSQEVPVEADDPGFSIPGLHMGNLLGYITHFREDDARVRLSGVGELLQLPGKRFLLTFPLTHWIAIVDREFNMRNTAQCWQGSDTIVMLPQGKGMPLPRYTARRFPGG